MPPAPDPQRCSPPSTGSARSLSCAFRWPSPGAEPARRLQRELVAQLDDYLLPRLRQLDAPLLAVVGGSTGAGKSTLVNSVGRSGGSAPPGVIRPTTRAPVLVHHPDDAAGSRSGGSCPARPATGAADDPGTLQLVASDGVPAGLAAARRAGHRLGGDGQPELAAQLLAAADLWLFVTTRRALRRRGAVGASCGRRHAAAPPSRVVLDRVPPEAAEEVGRTSPSMLREQGLGDAPLFVVPEAAAARTAAAGRAVAPVRTWLHGLAGDARRARPVVRGPSTACSTPAAPGAGARGAARRAGRGGDALRARSSRRTTTRWRTSTRPAARRLAAAGRGAGAVAGVRRHRRGAAGAGDRVAGCATG